MNQRSIAVLVAAPLLLVLGVTAVAVPLPFAAYSPGPTFDVLGRDGNDSELIQIDGRKTYRDDGQIRFTTVQSTAYGDRLSLGEAVSAWLDPDRAVIPYDVAHPDDQTAEEEETQGAVSMVTSQDTAVAIAMTELGEKVEPTIQVANVDEDGPSAKDLQVRDVFVSIDGEPVEKSQDVVDAIRSHDPGDPVDLVMRRDGRRFETSIEPTVIDGQTRIGIVLGTGYDFPYDVRIQVDPSIGGPSAGLMFSLAVYDTLTPGSLTGGATIAGTGELFSDGTVGPIGGIEQKIAGAEDAGAQLFFVPPDNCSDVTDLDPDLELVKADSMHDARLALEAWVADPDADLPRC